MQTHHLRHFLGVADAGSITRAAEHLGVAQPALTQSIKRLELQLGVALFKRSRRGVTLTEAGQAILDDVRASLAGIEAAQRHARDIGAGRAGTLRIGFVASVSYLVLPRALQALHNQLPDVHFDLGERTNGEQIEALEKGEIDVGILYTPAAVQGRMRRRVIARHPVVAAVHEGVSVGRDGKVSLRDLAREGLVFFGQGQVPHLRDQFLAAMQSLGGEAQVVQEANRTLTVLACVAARLGITVLSPLHKAIPFPGIRYCEVREQRLLPILELSAVWPARTRTSLADRFVEVLHATAAEMELVTDTPLGRNPSPG